MARPWGEKGRGVAAEVSFACRPRNGTLHKEPSEALERLEAEKECDLICVLGKPLWLQHRVWTFIVGAHYWGAVARTL